MGEKTRVAAAAGGALGLSGFAAALGLCCSVPWAVALLGVAGAVAFARLAFLLPYALIAAIALLAVGFWWAYRGRPVACDDGTCTAESRRPLQWVVWIAALLVVALASVAFAPRAMSAPPPYTVLDDSASHLRDDFNRAKGSVRLLFVVDPICPGCLRGLDDMNDSLLSKTNDPRIRTFVVHLPVIGAKAKDVAPAGKLLQNSNVQHYWNESGAFGRTLAQAVGLKRGDKLVYAWDVWLLYGPEATWEGESPPRPQRLMHQLWELEGNEAFPSLDSDAFAREVRQTLARAPASTK